MRFIEAGGLHSSDLVSLGIKVRVPVLDRFSPMSYCIAQHVHWCLSAHRGAETCYRESLQHSYILQGLPLFSELQEECIRCKKIRKRFMEQLMSPLSEHQLTIAPPFWAAQMDLFGPCTLFVPGRERETRQNPIMTYKAWVLVLICPVTKLINLQVCEKSDASGILDGLTRMFCEAGVPKVLVCDDGSAVVKALREVEIDIRNLEQKLVTEHGTSFKIVPVSGHNMNGLVERAIRTVQESLEESGLKTYKLNAMGLQSLCKLVENQFNNFPLGFKHSRDADNSEILKILTPNQLRHGRNNSRALDGPVRLPGSLSEMAQRVSDIYESWFKIWSTSAVPKLAHRAKWFHPHESLEKGDIVYFQKDSSGLDKRWTVGMVDEAIEGADGLVREVVIRYRNASENYDRFSNRAARSCVRLHNMDDQNLYDDLHELTQRLKNISDSDDLLNLLHSDNNSDKDRSDLSARSSLAIDSESFVSILGSSSDEMFQMSLGSSGANDEDEHLKEQLLTPRSRSPIGHSRSVESVLEEALEREGLKTPVIVCNDPDKHKILAQSCLPRARSASPTVMINNSDGNNIAKGSKPDFLNVFNHAKPDTKSSMKMSSASARMSAVSEMSRITTGKCRAAVAAKKDDDLKNDLTNCDIVISRKKIKECCTSHAKYVDIKLYKGGVPDLAFDLADLNLVYNERALVLKGPEQYSSLNEIIFSTELDVSKNNYVLQ